ncbi:MAG: hypothetical protein ACREJ3_01300 [Polyangiaceae bacterium]
MAKRTASEVWAALEDQAEDQAMDDEMEAVLAMTPEERRRELRSRGVDLEKVDAEAAAVAAAAVAAAAAEQAAARRKRRRLVLALPLAASLAAGAAVAVNFASSSLPVGAGAPVSTPMIRAEALRREARDACDGRDRRTCLDKLDQARALDPKGDATPEVQSLRHSAGDPASRVP